MDTVSSRPIPSTLRYIWRSVHGFASDVLFKYCRIAGTDIVVPIMSLGEDMKKLTLGDRGYSKDPFVLASAAGRLPTFKDVKKSLKVRCKHFYELTTRPLSDIDQDPDSSNNPDGRSSKYCS